MKWEGKSPPKLLRTGLGSTYHCQFSKWSYVNSYEFYINEGSKEDMAGLVCFMFVETFADRNFERQTLADFCLTVLQCYRDNPYHNAEHAFCFTHTMYLILASNCGYFDFVEVRK